MESEVGDDEYPECDFCGSGEVILNKINYFKGGRILEECYTVCDLCSSTCATNVVNYSYSDVCNIDILKTILYIGNEILKAIKANNLK